MKVTTIGLDIAKNVFQVHGIDEAGEIILTRRFTRRKLLPFFAKLPSCLIGIEACATAHHWARELVALGHEVKLMPPAYVKPYVKRSKTDAADAEAICEAVTRPSMRFVPVKSPDQQSLLMLHRTRSLVVRQRTMAANALRAHLAEFGLVCNPGVRNLITLVEKTFHADGAGSALPEVALRALSVLVRRLEELEEELHYLDRELHIWHRQSEVSQRLAAIPGIGVVTATALVATISDIHAFKSGRQFAAWLGLVPKQNSSGERTRLGNISKQGDRYLRRLLVVGATAVIRHCKRKDTPMTAWVRTMLEKKPARLVSVALANKIARTVWALLAHDRSYHPYHSAQT